MKSQEIEKYLNKKIMKREFIINEIKGDASKRKYYRALDNNNNSLILMDSSLEKRNFNNFLKFTDILELNKVNVPKIFDKNIKKRILIMEDLGENLIYDKVNKNNFFKTYEKAILNIFKIQKIKKNNINSYKKDMYFSESFLFIEWVLNKFFILKISKSDKRKLLNELHYLINNINIKNNKLIHRDYHSKNLFIKKNKIVIIDYQDAIYGSPLYDFVSLINDCYRDIKNKDREIFIKLFMQKFNDINKFNFSKDEFIHNFNLISAQRHMKASGIFCRLSIRNKRHNYLQHLNRTFNYIVKATSYYDNLHIINFFANEAINTLNESDYSCSR